MTGREKIEAALSKEGTPEIPGVICYEDIFVRDHWDTLTAVPWWYNREFSIEKQLQWHREVINGIRQDWVTLPIFGSWEYMAEDRDNKTISITPTGVFIADRRTGSWEPIPKPVVGGANIVDYLESLKIHAEIVSFEQLDMFIPSPVKKETDDSYKSGQRVLQKQILNEFSNLYPIYRVSSPLWECAQLWGYEEFMVATITNPELVKYACKRYLDLAVSSVHKAAAMGASAIWIEECFTDIISPEAFRIMNIPYVGQLIEAIRATGLKSIYYFTGNPAGKMDMILSTNPDAVSFEESKKNFITDIEDIVDAVKGRCTVLGNLDAIGILQDGSDGSLRAEIVRQLNSGRKNKSRFIMSLGSPVTPSTQVKRVQLYCDLVHDLGK